MLKIILKMWGKEGGVEINSIKVNNLLKIDSPRKRCFKQYENNGRKCKIFNILVDKGL